MAEKASWLIKPPTGIDHFAPRNIAVHGIEAAQVRSALDWRSSLGQIMDFSAGSPFVAYNSSFDSSVFNKATEHSGIPVPTNSFHCALKLAKRTLVLPKYRLPDVAAALNLPQFNHHDAGADAEVCAAIVLALAEQNRLFSVEELWPVTIASRPTSSTAYRPSARLSELPQPNPDATPSHPLHGHVLCFTGDLVKMSRNEAMTAAAAFGAKNGNSVTKKTTMLICGTGDSNLKKVFLSGGSSKERKALECIAAGQPIQALSEYEFLKLLGPAKAHRIPDALQDLPAGPTPHELPQADTSAPSVVLSWIGRLFKGGR